MVPQWSSIDDRSKVMPEITMIYEALIRNSIQSSAMYNYKTFNFFNDIYGAMHVIGGDALHSGPGFPICIKGRFSDLGLTARKLHLFII